MCIALRGCCTKAPVYMGCAGESCPGVLVVLVSRSRPKKPPRVMRIARSASAMLTGMARRRRFGCWICAGEISGGRGSVACWDKAVTWDVHAGCDDDGICEGFIMGSLLGVSSSCFSNWDWKLGLDDFGVCSLLIVMDVCSSFLFKIYVIYMIIDGCTDYRSFLIF